MHLLGISVVLAYFLYTNLANDFTHSDYYDYYEQEQMDEPVSVRKKRDFTTTNLLEMNLSLFQCVGTASYM